MFTPFVQSCSAQVSRNRECSVSRLFETAYGIFGRIAVALYGGRVRTGNKALASVRSCGSTYLLRSSMPSSYEFDAGRKFILYGTCQKYSRPTRARPLASPADCLATEASSSQREDQRDCKLHGLSSWSLMLPLTSCIQFYHSIYASCEAKKLANDRPGRNGELSLHRALMTSRMVAATWPDGSIATPNHRIATVRRGLSTMAKFFEAARCTWKVDSFTLFRFRIHAAEISSASTLWGLSGTGGHRSCSSPS